MEYNYGVSSKVTLGGEVWFRSKNITLNSYTFPSFFDFKAPNFTIMKTILSFLIIAFLFVGCKSSSKQLERGDYDAALQKSAKK